MQRIGFVVSAGFQMMGLAGFDNSFDVDSSYQGASHLFAPARLSWPKRAYWMAAALPRIGSTLENCKGAFPT
jgi:hypothetical protein